jgi:hypothetical protein
VIVPDGSFILVAAFAALPYGEGFVCGETCMLEAVAWVTVGGCCWPMTLAERLSNIVASVASFTIASKLIRRFIFVNSSGAFRRGWFKHRA